MMKDFREGIGTLSNTGVGVLLDGDPGSIRSVLEEAN
jgi:hypothetical protein